jgi:hypothetical protein
VYELRFVSVSEDGQHLVVSSPDLEDEAFLLPLTDELRDAVSAPPTTAPRPAPAYGEPLSPREIQTRVRAGESAEQIALATGLPVARIERFAGPVLSERAHIAQEARAARPAGQVEDVSRTLAELVDPRLSELRVDPETVAWDSWRRDDGVWTVQLGYDSEGDRHSAEWTWDPARRQLRSYGAAARALMAPRPQLGEPDEADESDQARQGSGLRMVPPRTAPPASVPTEAEAEAQSIQAHPSGRARKGRPSDDPDGVAKRAVVPSWDDIMFGVRKPDEPIEGP